MYVLPDPEPFFPLYATRSEIDALQEAIRFLQEALKREPGWSSRRMRLLTYLDRVQVSLSWQLQELHVLTTLVREQRPQLLQARHLLRSQNALQRLAQSAQQLQDEEAMQWVEQEMRANQQWFADCGLVLRFADCLQQWVLIEEEELHAQA